MARPRFDTLLAVVLALFLTAPLLLIIRAAFFPFEALGVSSEQWVEGAGAGQAFRYVIDTYGSHLATSLVVALAAGAFAIVLGTPAGLALALEGDRRRARLLEVLLTLPLAVPGLAAALALLSAYLGRVGTLGLLVVGHVLYTLPYTARMIGGAASTMGLRHALDAARTLGATPRQCVLHIVWPSLRRTVGAAALVALTVSWGEFNVSFLLAAPDRATFPTALYLTYTTNSFPIAAAATTLLLAGLVPLALLAQWIGKTPEQAA